MFDFSIHFNENIEKIKKHIGWISKWIVGNHVSWNWNNKNKYRVIDFSTPLFYKMHFNICVLVFKIQIKKYKKPSIRV